MRSATSHIQYLPQNSSQEKDAIIAPEDDALATTQKDKDLFDGMLNFTDEEEA